MNSDPRAAVYTHCLGRCIRYTCGGQAYLALNQGAEASAEFQKVLDHPGIVVSDPIGALARLQMGQAFGLSGDRGRAKSAYEDFLSLWKDADPNIPMFRQAKAEYAKLQSATAAE